MGKYDAFNSNPNLQLLFLPLVSFQCVHLCPCSNFQNVFYWSCNRKCVGCDRRFFWFIDMKFSWKREKAEWTGYIFILKAKFISFVVGISWSSWIFHLWDVSHLTARRGWRPDHIGILRGSIHSTICGHWSVLFFP